MSHLFSFQFDPETNTLRTFGWIALTIFSLVALLIVWGKEPFPFGTWEIRLKISGGLFIMGTASGIFSLFWPTGNRPLFVMLSIITYPIGLVFGYLLISVFFYLLVMPIGLVLRLMGHDILKRRIDESATTYWEKRKREREPEDYFKQF